MGGYGSGLYGSGGAIAKTTVEECRSIDIRTWQRRGLLNASSFNWEWRNSRGEKTGSISVFPSKGFLLLGYRFNQEPIETKVFYDETTTGFGKRKWFLCPACGERCAILYGKRKYFACRICYDLNYRSSQLSGDIGYYHSQLRKLCKTLKAEYEPMNPFPPPKPKNMHWKTYEKHAIRYVNLSDKLDRLWRERASNILNRGVR